MRRSSFSCSSQGVPHVVHRRELSPVRKNRSIAPRRAGFRRNMDKPKTLPKPARCFLQSRREARSGARLTSYTEERHRLARAASVGEAQTA